MRSSVRPTAVALCCLAFGLAPIAAQSGAPFAVATRSAPVDSGFLDHPGDRAAVVFRTRLHEPGATSVRVLFGPCNLPKDSRLRIRGARDGALQQFDARSLSDWSDASAVFNGDTVVLELEASAGSKANRVVVRALEVGLAMRQPPTDDLCGADDRSSQRDPRIGRQYPYGCTVWLANEFTAVTAGHCTLDPNQQVHFNVPPSDPNGVPVFPPPDDQYPYDAASMSRLDNGVGADWSVVRVLPNSNTGLYPGQAQGGWFDTGPVPSAGAAIMVSGYGVVADPTRLQHSQTLQSDSASLLSILTDQVVHDADTTSGSSGSPIVDPSTGAVIGVHTHGNCSFTGNVGTRIDRTDFAQALSTTRTSRILGRVARFGSGCATSAGTPRLEFRGYPAIGHRTAFELVSLPTGSAGVLVLGASRQSWGGTPLPWDLPGSPACSLLVSLDLTSVITPATPTCSWTVAVPQSPVLVGAELGAQGIVLEPVNNWFTLAASDALWMSVGRDV